MTLPLLGAHVSISGGLFRALERGASIGCRTIQIFTKNSNRWAFKSLPKEEIEQFRKVRRHTGINPVFAHGSYLINLAACGELYEKSVAALTEEVKRADQLGLQFVVLHPGAHRGIGEENGLKRVVEALDRVVDSTPYARVKIAIENTAGQGSCLGCTIEHLEYILDHVSKPARFGVCIDTCHLFAMGYDFRTGKTYQNTFRKLLDHIPLQKILAFHLNDSKKPLHSRVDRHEHIGKGYLGLNAFRHLLNDKRFLKIPKVLETPKGKDLAEDEMNLKILQRLSKL